MTIQNIKQQFVDWTKKKIRHHFAETTKEIYFHEGQIWWATMGKNVGFEMDGKHELFHRPVLILKKYNKDICFVIPLTSQIKCPLPWYQIPLEFDVKPSVVNISQGRTISVKRLLRKENVATVKDFQKITKAFREQFL